MNPSVFKRFKSILYITSAILAGVFLFFAQAALDLNSGVLNPDFHRQLFEKHDIYGQTQEAINSYTKGFINNLKKSSPQSYEQHKYLFNLLENSFSPKMIRINLDSLREGTFQYLKGERMFLPDIYLNAGSSAKSASKKAEDNNPASLMLSKIDKVNLSAVLLYINRGDITDLFMLSKLLYYLLHMLPGFCMLALVMLFLAGLAACKRFFDILRWAAYVFITCSGLEIAAGSMLFAYGFWRMPGTISSFAASLPLNRNILAGYTGDCVNHTSVILLGLGFLFLSLSIIVLRLPRLFPSTPVSGSTESSEKISNRKKTTIQYSIYAVLFLLILITTGFKAISFKSSFEANDFNVVLSKFFNRNTVTQVISARNDAIYTLEVKLVDSQSGEAIRGIQMNINGTSEISKKNFNLNMSSDQEGSTKFSLDKGNFRLSFAPAVFPQEYQLPSPFSFDMKSAGTTIITVKLDKKPDIYLQKWGIAEVEVLDKDNKPVPDLDLQVESIVFAPGQPDTIHSYTNSEGIAVFKVNEGNYKIGFLQEKFPKKYTVPVSLDVSVTQNTVTRYTIRLAEVKKK